MNLIETKNYAETMEILVKPFLDSCSQELWFNRVEHQKIHCMKYEAKDAKGVIIISHGFTETAEKYMEVVYYFLKEHYHVYIPEHCGHGYSYRLTGDLCKVHVDDYRRYVDDFSYIAHYIKKQERLPLYLFAHSMGSAIGVLAAAKYPQLFEKIILNSPMIRPTTGKMPWVIVKCITFMACHFNLGEIYLPGHHGYQGLENFETSCSLSRERFDYYNEKKAKTKAYQTSGASFNWMNQAIKMNHALMMKANKKIKQPCLLFQAEKDEIVSLSEQKRFIQKISLNGNRKAKMIKIPNAKHEIFNSDDELLRRYWERVFMFLNEK